MVFEKANPKNRRTVREVSDAFWATDPPISHPPARCLLNESHLGYAAYGAYGIGENVGASMSGIAVSAIHNATGKWVMDCPTTPDRVLKALGKI